MAKAQSTGSSATDAMVMKVCFALLAPDLVVKNQLTSYHEPPASSTQVALNEYYAPKKYRYLRLNSNFKFWHTAPGIKNHVSNPSISGYRLVPIYNNMHGLISLLFFLLSRDYWYAQFRPTLVNIIVNKRKIFIFLLS